MLQIYVCMYVYAKARFPQTLYTSLFQCHQQIISMHTFIHSFL